MLAHTPDLRILTAQYMLNNLLRNPRGVHKWVFCYTGHYKVQYLEVACNQLEK